MAGQVGVPLERRKRPALCAFAGIALSFSSAQALAQQNRELPQSQAFDCKQLLAGAENLRLATIEMLVTVREQRKEFEKMRDVLGADVADESIGALAAQEQGLESTLRETEAVRCPPDSTTNKSTIPR